MLLKCILLASAGYELPVSFHFILCSCSLDVRRADGTKHVTFSQLLSPSIAWIISKVHCHTNTTKGISCCRKADENVKLLHDCWLPTKQSLNSSMHIKRKLLSEWLLCCKGDIHLLRLFCVSCCQAVQIFLFLLSPFEKIVLASSRAAL